MLVMRRGNNCQTTGSTGHDIRTERMEAGCSGADVARGGRVINTWTNGRRVHRNQSHSHECFLCVIGQVYFYGFDHVQTRYQP